MHGRLHMEDDAQEMPQGKLYLQYLYNSDNKTDLIKRFNIYTSGEDVRSKLKYPVTINYGKDTYQLINSEKPSYFHVKRQTLKLSCSVSLLINL